MNAGMKSMLNIMSKYLNMGMPVKDIILRASWNPAKSIKRGRPGKFERRRMWRILLY
jgi:dihydroorotase